MPAVAGGPTALVILVPETEPLVGRWRQRYDTSTADGMSAHITVLYPFLPAAQVTDEDVEALRATMARVHPLELTFARCGRFPDVLYLQPDPAEPIRQLTEQIAARWPQCPPYGGAFAVDDIVPHATVAVSRDEAVLAEAERDVTAQLPLQLTLTEAVLFQPDGRWRRWLTFPFAG